MKYVFLMFNTCLVAANDCVSVFYLCYRLRQDKKVQLLLADCRTTVHRDRMSSTYDIRWEDTAQKYRKHSNPNSFNDNKSPAGDNRREGVHSHIKKGHGSSNHIIKDPLKAK